MHYSCFDYVILCTSKGNIIGVTVVDNQAGKKHDFLKIIIKVRMISYFTFWLVSIVAQCTRSV